MPRIIADHSRQTGTIGTGCSKVDVPKGIRHTITWPRCEPNSSLILITQVLEEGDLILHAESFNTVECNQWARKSDKVFWGETHWSRKWGRRKFENRGQVQRLDVPLCILSLGGCKVSSGRRMMYSPLWYFELMDVPIQFDCKDRWHHTQFTMEDVSASVHKFWMTSFRILHHHSSYKRNGSNTMCERNTQIFSVLQDVATQEWTRT